MLYERWCRIVADRRDALALRDHASGRHWTFEELRAASEKCDFGTGDVVYPEGNSPEFIFALLHAWRLGKIACPLAPGQAPPTVPPPPSGCVHLKTSSASTGAPRLSAFTADQLVADAENIVATMGLRPDWANLGVISLAHSYGFSNLVLPLLLHGIPLILVPSPLPEIIRRAAGEEQALTVAAVPALWRAWHEAGAIPSNVKLALSAGAPLPLSLERAVFETSGIKIHNFYGSTECGGIAYDDCPEPRADEACAGKPLRNVDLSLNADGCLAVRSRAVGETYWPEPAESLAAGRFQTSDLAELKDGRVFLRGRLSDLINVAGRKVSPLLIEQALADHPAVLECLVFGVPGRDETRADMIVACVVKRSPVTADALREFLSQKIPAWQIPREWRWVDTLSQNPLGKTSRLAWRRLLQEAQPDDV